MPHLRLIGLALFITAIFLALAAAITKTTHIRVQLPSSNTSTSAGQNATVLPPSADSSIQEDLSQPNLNSVQFTAVPIVWPLIIAAGFGLSLWFSHFGELKSIARDNPKQRRRR